MIDPLAAVVAVSICFTGCQERRDPAPAVIGNSAVEVRSLTGGEGSALATADWNEDGHADVVVSDGQELVVLLGDGRGNLRPSGRYDAGPNPAELAAADVDGDGRTDLIAANHETRHLTLLSGDGRGGFAEGRRIDVDVEPHVHIVVPGDVDGDGIVDLTVDHRHGGGLLILPGLGAGRFGSGTVVDGGGDPYRQVAAADINGDGRTDFALPNPRDVGILLNGGAAPRSWRLTRPVPAATPFAVALADLDGDDQVDLVAASGEGSDIVQVYRGDGLGGFAERSESPFRMAPGATRIVVGDFDGDGLADAAVCGWDSPVVHVLFGGPDRLRVGSVRTGAQNPWGMIAVDLNEDGRDDLIVADGSGRRVTLFLSTEETP